MEPLSAFSVACNVLQIIEVGAKTLSKVVEYRNASDGLLAEHRDLANVARSLNNLNADLQASLPKAHGTKVLTAAETRLIDANNECLRISNDFIQLLDRLRVRNKSTIMDALRVSIKSLWHKEKVAAMERSIGQARDNLNVAFIVLINSKQSSLATQSGLETRTTRLESNILQAVAASSGYIHDEVKDLSLRLDGLNLGAVAQDVVNGFLSTHHDFLQHLSTQLNSICAMNLTQQARITEAGAQEAEHRIMASLQFPQMGHRKHQIHTPHERSFRWIINEDDPHKETIWSNFLVWLRAENHSHTIYWIHGKPGSGKSSLVAFLDDNLDPVQHMQPWAGHDPYVKASYYFWSSGDSVLQKSMAGMMRSILYELLEQTPEIVPRVVSLRRWRSARGHDTSLNPWTDGDLREMVHECVKCIGESRKIILFLDGLDEIQTTYDALEDVTHLVQSLAALPNVKICMSSRPMTVFVDAFGPYPQLRLQDLTQGDISMYVSSHFEKQASFRNMRSGNPKEAEEIVREVISAADGVFLWVRLVVRELTRCLQDGSGFTALRRSLRETPRDLDAYFQKIMDSIEPEYQKEASMMLQIALWEEEELNSVAHLRLLDLSFVEEGWSNFGLVDSWQGRRLDFTDANALRFRMDSSFRKLQSRCKGLLECYYRPGSTMRTIVEADSDYSDNSDGESGAPHAGPRTKLSDSVPSALSAVSSGQIDKLFAFDFSVDFLHRSLRDFLLTPQSQRLLERYSNGPIDARRFQVHARLAQARAVMRARLHMQLGASLVSHVLYLLATPQMRMTEHGLELAAWTEPVVEAIMAANGYKSTFWYISAVLDSWYEEQSSFLTLAIDYRLDAYLQQHLTTVQVKGKTGRPLLDHALRPRFTGTFGMNVGLHFPEPRLAAYLISLGADPNERYQSSSVWSLYLCFLNDYLRWRPVRKRTPFELQCFFQPLEVMIRADASFQLPRSWLGDRGQFQTWESQWCRNEWFIDTHDSEQLFDCRWPDVRPIASCEDLPTAEQLYDVADLLNHFRPDFGDDIDRLKCLISQRVDWQVSNAT